MSDNELQSVADYEDVEKNMIIVNLEYWKIRDDVLSERNSGRFLRKKCWLDLWKQFVSERFDAECPVKNAKLKWYSKDDLIKSIEDNQPQGEWFKQVIVEVCVFKPYFSFGNKSDKKLCRGLHFCKPSNENDFLDSLFQGKDYYNHYYIEDFRKKYSKAFNSVDIVSSIDKKVKRIMKAIVIPVSLFSLIFFPLLFGEVSKLSILFVLFGVSFSILAGIIVCYIIGSGMLFDRQVAIINKAKRIMSERL